MCRIPKGTMRTRSLCRLGRHDGKRLTIINSREPGGGSFHHRRMLCSADIFPCFTSCDIYLNFCIDIVVILIYLSISLYFHRTPDPGTGPDLNYSYDDLSMATRKGPFPQAFNSGLSVSVSAYRS
jgi:hypothetical protein